MLRRVMPILGASVCAWLALAHDTDLHAGHACHIPSSDTHVSAAAFYLKASAAELSPHCLATLTAASAVGGANLMPPRPQSPHWDHIAISDFARGYYWSNEPTKDADRQWLAARVDLIEGNSASDPYVQAMRQGNPTLGVFRYRLDHYDFANEKSRVYPESHVLHVMNTTKLTLKGRDVGEQGLTFAPGDRFQFLVWNDRYVMFNLKDAATRQWNIHRLLSDLDGLQGLFLDAHAHDFPTVIGMTNGQTKIATGGGIAEYGGRTPTDPTLIQDYQRDMVTWLTELAASAKAKGKFLLLNQASYMLDASAKQQIIAANGTGTEFMHQPLAWAGWYQYADYLALTKQLIDAGGVVDAEGHWCYTGNFDRARWNLWRLAAYYQIKEPVGSRGKVYLNLSLCSNSTVRPSQDRPEWLPAYQVDVGQPVGETTLFTEGKAGTSTSDGRPCDYKIYGREYTKSLVLVRPKDFWDCTDYGDGAAAMVTLPKAMRALRDDGTVGEPLFNVRIRNAEAVILMKNGG
ncbi:hypothetical protein [Nitrospira sp. Nam74]